MANPLKGEASIALDGETLDLVIDNDALVIAEDACGRSLIDIVGEVYGAVTAQQAPKLGTQRALLFAATRANHPELTIADCGDRIMVHGPKLTVPLARTLLDAMPKAKEKSAGEKATGEAKAPAPAKTRRPARAGTGTGS